MWLFHYDHNDVLRFDQYLDPIPEYAILSHRWRDPGEVRFQDVEDFLKQKKKIKHTSGAKKIRSFGEQARRDGISAFWVDTCCINKESSAELQEAINSMYQWYRAAAVCYVYLDDVYPQQSSQSVAEFTQGPAQHTKLFKRQDGSYSEWFERAWTLQELIAPQNILFFDRSWKLIGSRAEFASSIAQITGIAQTLLGLKRRQLSDFSIAQRMSWASRRKATRREDIAYSLLGIFSVNMAMLYGEGQQAFKRLQEEIIKNSTDQSIFAWDHRLSQSIERDILAPSPAEFAKSKDIVPWSIHSSRQYQLTNAGLNIKLPVVHLERRQGELQHGVVLSCRSLSDPMKAIVLPVNDRILFPHDAKLVDNTVVDARSYSGRIVKCSIESIAENCRLTQLTLSRMSSQGPRIKEFRLGSSKLSFRSVSPPDVWTWSASDDAGVTGVKTVVLNEGELGNGLAEICLALGDNVLVICRMTNAVIRDMEMLVQSSRSEEPILSSLLSYQDLRESGTLCVHGHGICVSLENKLQYWIEMIFEEAESVAEFNVKNADECRFRA